MIIGITGKLQSGKTTSANMIKSEWDTKILSFAGILKEMVLNSGLCKREELYEKKTDFSRLILQKLGTEIIRKQIDENFFIKKMSEKISENPNDSLIVIDDLRFLNEAEFVRNMGGKLIRIVRPSLEQIGEESKHASEVEQDQIKVDFTILNDITLDDLRINILRYVEDNCCDFEVK